MEINVNLPDHRYTLTMEKGLLQDVGNWVKKKWQPQRIVVVTDETVEALYGETVITS